MDIRRRAILSETLHEGGSSEGAINIDNYLTIEALEDGLTAKLSVNACEYCVDGDGNWKILSADTATQSINTGHTLSFRGSLTPVKNVGIGTFTISKKCNLSGKCASMLYGDGAANNYSISSKAYAFYMLFTNNNTIIDASQLELPTNTSNYCYNAMFYQCRNLVGAPTLGTSTSLGCYNSMFRECDRLVTPPALPATVAASGCYKRMFQDCHSLLEAPELPAKGINEQCYQYMFAGCTSLTTAPELPATTLARYCYDSMFNVCTSLTTAPELPAVTLASNCYYRMFSGCKNLRYIKMLATNISATNCLNSWVDGVASSGTFVKKSAMTTLPTGSSGIPSGWTVQNA